MDPFLSLANRLYEVVVANLTAIQAWGFYLTDPEFDDEPELRNKLATLWIGSLIDTLEAESRFLPEAAKEAKEKGFVSLAHNAQQLQNFCVIVGEVLALFTREEQIFLADLRNQWVHTYFANRHRDKISVKYADKGKIVTETLTRQQYVVVMESIYRRGDLDRDILSPMVSRALDKKLRYWPVLGIMQRDKHKLYDALRQGERIEIRI
jgi:uncharacterized membrane protein YcgQ (UPF0703/DUF1980 family)